MGRKKSNKNISVLRIFFNSIKVYFMYLDRTAKYLLVPVLGQTIGIFLILMITYHYNTNVNAIRNIPFFAQSDEHVLFGLFLVLSPFLALFIHSLYRYIIAFTSLNVVFYTLAPKKNVKEIDFKANDRVIERRLFQYILLMLFVTILCLFPPTWIVLCLAFQIFALETDTNCVKAISRSIKYTMEHMFSIILMLILVYALTYWFLPALFIWALEKVSFVDFMVTKTEVYLQLLPYREINAFLAKINQHTDSVTLAKMLVNFLLMFIITGFTLPMRCCCFTEMYRKFDNEQIKEFSKEDEEIIKRATSKKERTRKG